MTNFVTNLNSTQNILSGSQRLARRITYSNEDSISQSTFLCWSAAHWGILI